MIASYSSSVLASASKALALASFFSSSFFPEEILKSMVGSSLRNGGFCLTNLVHNDGLNVL